jgi:membrane-bound serine protease (ClpP class)
MRSEYREIDKGRSRRERAKMSLSGRIVIVLLIASIGLACSSLAARVSAQATGTAREAVVLDIDGAIGPATTLYLRQGFAAAIRRNAAVIVLEMNTPGGLDSAMRDIIGDMLASPIPVIAYVHPSGARAASAGTYILYASQLAAMTPGTHLGAATPVQLGGGRQPLGGGGSDRGKDSGKDSEAPVDAMTAKTVNDAVAYIRGLAELQGRNEEWAERAVRQAATLTAAAALKLGVIEIIAPDIRSLLNQADGRIVKLQGRAVRLETAGLRINRIEPNWRAQLLAVITNPNVAYILLLIGFYGILFEFFNPGTIASGVIGAIALLTALFALNLMPINFAGLALIGLGVALMVAEAFTPSFGILGIGGAAALALGSLFLFENVPGFTVSIPVILTATVASALIVIIGLAAALRAHRRKIVTGEPALLGSHGQVLEWSGGHGQVLVHGERWQAHAATALAAGQRVRVKGRDGLDLLVEPDAEPIPIAGERHAD